MSKLDFDGDYDHENLKHFLFQIELPLLVLFLKLF
jgi:hypothetical protein